MRDRRYLGDGRIVTTTGVTASIPVSSALVEAIGGRERAAAVAAQLGVEHLLAAHDSERFRLRTCALFTVASNYLSFWSHDDFSTLPTIR